MKAITYFLIIFFTLGFFRQDLCFSQKVEDRFWQTPDIRSFSFPDTNSISYSAEVLFEYGNAYFKDFDEHDNIILDYHVSIKILRKEGMRLGTISIPVYTFNEKQESIDKIVGVTYYLENDKVIKDQLNKTSITETATDRHYRTINFTMPDVQVGSIIEYSFQKSSGFFNAFVPWVFQKEVPVAYSKFIANIPLNYHYKISEPRSTFIQKSELSSLKHSSFITTRAYIKKNAFDHDGPDPSYSNYLRKSSYNIQCHSIMWEAQNVPPVKSNSENETGVEFEFISYDYPEIREPGSFLAALECVSVKPSKESWESLTESLLNHKYLGKLLAKNDFLDKKVAPVISSANNSSDKVKLIINYIQSNFKWNGENKLFLSDNLDKIWKDKTGNSADLNSLFICMLMKANINAYALVSATNDFNTNFTPSIKNFNYLQSLFQIDKDYYAYDIINVFRQGGNKVLFSIKNNCLGLAEGDPKLIDLNKIKIMVQ
jgi:hypothetical protein